MALDKYKDALLKILDIELGIYPAKVTGGPNPYEERNDFQNGWNAAVIKMAEEQARVLVEIGLGDGGESHEV